MSRKDKLLKRFLSVSKDFTYAELVTLLGHFGYKEESKGKTSGSRVAFFKENTNIPIITHKPHPSPNLKPYQIRQIINELKNEKLLQ